MSDKQWVFDNPQEAADLIEQLQQRNAELEIELKNAYSGADHAHREVAHTSRVNDCLIENCANLYIYMDDIIKSAELTGWLPRDIEALKTLQVDFGDAADGGSIIEKENGVKLGSFIAKIKQERDELAATVELLRDAYKVMKSEHEGGYLSASYGLELFRKTLELTPKQSLNALKREVAMEAFVAGFMESGEGYNGELYQDGWKRVVDGLNWDTKDYLDTKYPTEGE